jgi:hypothetical protein
MLPPFPLELPCKQPLFTAPFPHSAQRPPWDGNTPAAAVDFVSSKTKPLSHLASLAYIQPHSPSPIRRRRKPSMHGLPLEVQEAEQVSAFGLPL